MEETRQKTDHLTKQLKPIWYVIIIASSLRFLVLFFALYITKDYSVFHHRDTTSYFIPAMELASTAQFTTNGLTEFLRTPGYSLFLVPGILLNNPEGVTIILQILVSCFTLYLVYKTALLLFEKSQIAILCALMFSVEPISILYTSKLLTETLFTGITTLSLYYLLKYLRTRSLDKLLISAVALAASVYVRPISYFLPILITGFLLTWIALKMQNNLRILIHTGLFILVSMGLIGLWQIRNKIQTGYGGFSAISDANLYFYQGASVLAGQKGLSYYEMRNTMGYYDEDIYLQYHPEQRGWERSQRYTYMREEGIKIIIDNPFTYAKIHLKGMIRTLLDPAATEYLKLYKLYPESGGLLGIIVDKGLIKTVIHLFTNKPLIFWSNLLLGVFLITYYLFGLSALVSKKFSFNAPVIMVLCIAAYFIIISGGPNSLNRFRHPIMPIVCMLGGYGLSLFLGKIRLRKSKRSSKKILNKT